jgi:hypothetical protein
MKRLPFLLGVLNCLAFPVISLAAEIPDLPKPALRSVINFCGWTVRVDDRLLAGTNLLLGKAALGLLEAKLRDIHSVVGKERLKALQSVNIILDLTHGSLGSMQYHPSPDWLQEHGYSREMAKCVHIPQAGDFARTRQINEQPWVVLHELAHAYHDQVIGFDNPRIKEAYDKFKQSRHGDRVLLFDGTYTRHYAMTDVQEFFAEFTESYFGLNDFFPFNRAELKTAEPEIYQLMLEIWGPVQTGPLVLENQGLTTEPL